MGFIQRAILCGHDFDPDDFPNYPDDYAGYCPHCVSKMKDSEDEEIDGDDEPDGTGIMEFDGSSFAEDDEEGNDSEDIDAVAEDEDNIDEDPLADETEEDEDRDIEKSVDTIEENLNLYKERLDQPTPLGSVFRWK